MDESVRNRLIDYALAIEKFRSLDKSEQEWLLPLLSRGFKNTVRLLDLIADEPMTFEEIAEAMAINPQTVNQKLNALAEGGMSLNLTETAAYAPTGRPRKLVRK